MEETGGYQEQKNVADKNVQVPILSSKMLVGNYIRLKKENVFLTFRSVFGYSCILAEQEDVLPGLAVYVFTCTRHVRPG